MNPDDVFAVAAATMVEKYVVDSNFFGRAIWTFSFHCVRESSKRLLVPASIWSMAAIAVSNFWSRLSVNGLFL